MKWRFSLLLVGLLGAVSWSAPPKTEPVVEGVPGKPVFFDIKASDPKKKIGWAAGFDKKACPVVRLYSEDPSVMSFMAFPSKGGDYYLTFWTEGEVVSAQTVLKVKGGKDDDDKDDDNVDPPNPPDPPQPKGVVSRFVVVEDTLKAGPWRGIILGDPKLESFYRQLRGNRTTLIHVVLDINASKDSPDAKRFVPLSIGKQLPYLFLLDASDKIIKECPAPIESVDAFIAAFDTFKDTPRAMGLIVGKPKLQWKEFGSTPNTPIIPRDQWKTTGLTTTFLPPVYDQDGIGQCASSACCTAIETAAYLQGIRYPKLSAGDLYSRVNGGRDRGSMLEDNLDEAIRNGVAPASMIPYIWDGRRHNDTATVAARRKHRIIEAYWCPSFEAMASAIQQGFVVEHGLMWPNANPDAEGWLSERSRRSGGHALVGYRLEKRGSTWGIRTRNSWSSSWGMAGDCIIPEGCFEGQIGGYFAIRVVTDPSTVTILNPRLNPFSKENFAFASYSSDSIVLAP